MTGGLARTTPVGLFASRTAPLVPAWEPLWPLLTGLALLLLPLDAALRLAAPGVMARRRQPRVVSADPVHDEAQEVA